MKLKGIRDVYIEVITTILSQPSASEISKELNYTEWNNIHKNTFNYFWDKKKKARGVCIYLVLFDQIVMNITRRIGRRCSQCSCVIAIVPSGLSIWVHC